MNNAQPDDTRRDDHNADDFDRDDIDGRDLDVDLSEDSDSEQDAEYSDAQGDEDGEFSMRGIRLPQPRPAEHLLMNKLVDCKAKRVLCTTVGRGQLAGLLANLDSSREVVCHTLDFYQAENMVAYHSRLSPNLKVVCEPDFPEDGFDFVAMPTAKKNEAELTRDLLQQAYQRLNDHCPMVVAVDKEDDQWLHGEMKKMFKKVTRLQKRKGVIYSAVKHGPLKKVKDFAAEFAFRDNDRLIKMISRPGVFSHRRLDVGARALMTAMEIHIGSRVLDIGCGSGAVGIAAALRTKDVAVHAIDSNPRAIECTRRNAAENNAVQLTAELDCDGQSVGAGEYDLVLANPPYFSNYRIAELFLEIAAKAVKVDGTVLFVTKMPNWFIENIPRWFVNFEHFEVRNYHVFEIYNPVSV